MWGRTRSNMKVRMEGWWEGGCRGCFERSGEGRGGSIGRCRGGGVDVEVPAGRGVGEAW